MGRVNLFGLDVVDCSIDDAFLKIIKMSGFSYILTPNVQHIAHLSKDCELKDFYKDSSLILCDSKIVKLISKIVAKPIEHVVPGSDLTKYLFDNHIFDYGSVMVVGSTAADVEYLSKKYAVDYIAHYNPPMGFINDTVEVLNVVDAIVSFKPRYLFLALGFPRQEILARIIKENVDFNCTVFCIGASIDFMTGKQNRAPLLFQKLHLEWLFRFFNNPIRLFRRYFVDGWSIIPAIFNEFKKK